jgi:hypothetical protein
MPSTDPNGNIGGHPLDELGLPFATTEGLNTMGCLINGEPWLPLKENLVGDLVYHIPFSVGAQSMGGGVSIQGIRDFDNWNEVLDVVADPAESIGFFEFPSYANYYIDSNSGCGFYDLDTTFNSYVQITKLDFNSEIVSGRFEMQVVNENCDTLTITHGRFDLSS